MLRVGGWRAANDQRASDQQGDRVLFFLSGRPGSSRYSISETCTASFEGNTLRDGDETVRLSAASTACLFYQMFTIVIFRSYMTRFHSSLASKCRLVMLHFMLQFILQSSDFKRKASRAIVIFPILLMAHRVQQKI